MFTPHQWQSLPHIAVPNLKFPTAVAIYCTQVVGYGQLQWSSVYRSWCMDP